MAISSIPEAPSDFSNSVPRQGRIIPIADVYAGAVQNIQTPTNAAAHVIQAVILDSGPTPRERRPLTIPLEYDVGYSYVPLVAGPPAEKSRIVSTNMLEGSPKVKTDKAQVPVVKVTGKSVIRRDSLKRREALLRGKEGSRRRQKWENDRLLHNPYFQPPTSSDWSPVPLPNPHENKPVRYELAQLWEHPTFQGMIVKNKEYAQQRKNQAQEMQKNLNESPSGKMPKELKERLKKAKGVLGLLKSLEEQVRIFILEQEVALASHAQGNEMSPQNPTSPSPSPEEEEEIILFRPRKSCKGQVGAKKNRGEVAAVALPPPVKPLHHACPSDPSASFTRWLIHSIAKYYGLKSWSVTDKIVLGKNCVQEVRVAYVGIGERKGNGKTVTVTEETDTILWQHGSSLPRPLWAML